GATSPLYDSTGQRVGAVEVIRDITGRKRLEEERQKLEQQLFQAQKMESIGQLAGGVAHDFNNMLGVIIGNTEMAMEGMDSTSPAHKALLGVLNAGMRSAGLTRQLLAFARKQAISPKILDLNDTVTGMLKMLRRLIGESIDLVWRPGEDLWRICIDPSQVDQLLANLVVNARDAIGKTGQVTIETANTTCGEAFGHDAPDFVPGDYVRLEVRDDGCGMDRETQARIFEPFFTTKRAGEGTGLGLATVYGIVKQNNGFIEVNSEPGRGTAFRLFLPRSTAEGPRIRDQLESTQALGGTETVLIVEDEDAMLGLSQGMLEKLGYHVLAARETEQALRLAAAHDGPIDLLLTDVVMPGMNGLELAERIGAIRPGLKCLFMSGYTADMIARQGFVEGGARLITKPFSLRELAAKVREALT
ncbi:MAG TPA: ATP-binding protein, partial [Candidatus Aminicenantes bacterium]|nr:ATP-binding protein [Candidatus Aminicenantes bacterium]